MGAAAALDGHDRRKTPCRHSGGGRGVTMIPGCSQPPAGRNPPPHRSVAARNPPPATRRPAPRPATQPRATPPNRSSPAPLPRRSRLAVRTGAPLSAAGASAVPAPIARKRHAQNPPVSCPPPRRGRDRPARLRGLGTVPGRRVHPGRNALPAAGRDHRGPVRPACAPRCG